MLPLLEKISRRRRRRQVGVASPRLDKSGEVAVFTVVANTAPPPEAGRLVENLRDNVVPQALEGTDLTAVVGGPTAGYIDLAARIIDKLPLMIAIVVGLSFSSCCSRSARC